jgi:hypothetical protein
MTYEEYWYGDVWLIKLYREADKLKLKRKNEEAWLQGMYFYEGVCVALGNAFRQKSDPALSYPSQPYPVFKEEQPQKDEEAEVLKAKLYMQNMMRMGKNWGKKN